MNKVPLALSRRQRETPFEKRVLEHKPKGFSIYNHMTLPTAFKSLEADYAHLCKHVQLWDVACERQVEVAGPDALRLVELCTPRDLSDMRVGQGRYAPLVDEHGGVVNDPIVLKLAQERYWLSISDSDVMLWLKGLAVGMKLDVRVFEPDVSPLALQGPKADDVLASLVGEHVRSIKFFWFIEEHIAGVPVLIARSGWSGKGGYEIYMKGSENGTLLWDTMFNAGQSFNIRAGCPNLIERLETGLLSYGNDMTLENNPFECGLDRFFKLGKSAEYMSREALERIAAEGVGQKLMKLKIHQNKPIPMRSTYPVYHDDRVVGAVTSQAHSKKYGAVLSFAYVPTHLAREGQMLQVCTDEHEKLEATVCEECWNPVV